MQEPHSVNLGLYTTVKAYGYRKAEVDQRFLVVHYDRDDAWDKLRQKLAGRAGTTPDNHQCFTVSHRDGGQLHFQFSDWQCYVGAGLNLTAVVY